MSTNPQHIISLVPSLTELIADLGLEDLLVGRTRFCVHPDRIIDRVPIIGGTKNPRIDKINQIRPDLIIANREENRKEDIKELEKDFNVLLTDISTIEDALLTLHQIGEICHAGDRVSELIASIQRELEYVPKEPRVRVAYFIWRDPWMSIGNDTYIHSVLNHWNLENIFNDQTRYPKTTLEEVSQRNPNIILLSSEPFPFKEKHKQEVYDACPDSRVLLVNGEWFSWYGSRMLPSFKKLNTFRKAIS